MTEIWPNIIPMTLAFGIMLCLAVVIVVGIVLAVGVKRRKNQKD